MASREEQRSRLYSLQRLQLRHEQTKPAGVEDRKLRALVAEQVAALEQSLAISVGTDRRFDASTDAYEVLQAAGYEWDPMSNGHWINRKTQESAKVRADGDRCYIAWLGKL